jgi:hypothetical protein
MARLVPARGNAVTGLAGFAFGVVAIAVWLKGGGKGADGKQGEIKSLEAVQAYPIVSAVPIWHTGGRTTLGQLRLKGGCRRPGRDAHVTDSGCQPWKFSVAGSLKNYGLSWHSAMPPSADAADRGEGGDARR